MVRNVFLYFLICVMALSLVLTGCSTSNEIQEEAINNQKQKEVEVTKDPVGLKVGFADGIPALSMAKLAKEQENIQDNIIIDYELIKGPDLIVSKVMNKEFDIAIVPSNLASVAYNKSESYAVGGISGFGNLYIVSRENISSIQDLKGKDITTIGKGLTPDIVLQYILNSNNIDPLNDVNINYMGGATELAPAFLSKKADIILAPEPIISTILSKDKTAKIQFSLNELFAETTNSNLGFPQTVLIIKKDLIENYSDFINKFLNKYEQSINWGKDNIDLLVEYSSSLDITVSSEVLDSESMSRMNLDFISGDEMKDIYMKYMKVLLEFNPKTIGGKLPDEGIFYTK